MPPLADLPVQFQRHLHLPGGIDLIGDHAEHVAVQIGVTGPKNGAVEEIEGLPAKIQALRLAEVKRLGETDVLVEGREAPDFRIEAPGPANDPLPS